MKDHCEEILGQLVVGEALTTAQQAHLQTCPRCQGHAGIVQSLEERRKRPIKASVAVPPLAQFHQADRQRLRKGVGLLLLIGTGILGLYSSQSPQPVPDVDIFAALDEGFAGSQTNTQAEGPPGTELLSYFEPAALPLEIGPSEDILPDWSL